MHVCHDHWTILTLLLSMKLPSDKQHIATAEPAQLQTRTFPRESSSWLTAYLIFFCHLLEDTNLILSSEHWPLIDFKNTDRILSHRMFLLLVEMCLSPRTTPKIIFGKRLGLQLFH